MTTFIDYEAAKKWYHFAQYEAEAASLAHWQDVNRPAV
ncbi:MAG: hypothetical protein CBARDCOR_6290 [uncultured Caballeronia sp.]|nr:MAG: hypothetical protein CBARDCOR_6290 [uncultured Caballeronia sp.]